MGSGFLKKKKQAKMMQQQFSEMQAKLSQELDALEVTGRAGNGLVEIILGGNNEMKKIKINPECVDPEDIHGLEALIKAAYNEAQTQLKSKTEANSMMGGMPDLASLMF